MSHRALILGGLAQGRTEIHGLLESEDVLRTVSAIQAFGACAERLGAGEWRIKGAVWRSPKRPIDCGNSGTAARLLIGAAAGFPIEATFTGDESLCARPMQRVLTPLRRMGVRTSGEALPVTISGGVERGIDFVNEPASAQVKSAILLAGLGIADHVTVTEPAASRDHTEDMLRAFGCDVERDDRRVRLGTNRVLHGTRVEITGDPSSAAFPMVAALIVPNSVVMAGAVMINPSRIGLVDTLREMGADIVLSNERAAGGERIASWRAHSSPLHGVEVPAARAPSMIDEYPVLAIAAACATGTTVMRGLAELRVKESDRLAAIVAGLQACGVDAWADADILTVRGCGGRPPGGTAVCARRDHRIAMSFLILGLAARKPVEVDSAEMIATSFPRFADAMRSLGANID